VTVLSSPRVRRWLVPCTAALAVLGGGVAIGFVTAAADPTLPPRSAAQLLVDVQSAQVDGLSGTVVARVDLGLPAITIDDGGPDLTALLSGTHTVRVWYAQPNQARIAVLGPLGETDVINNGADQWVWSSKDKSAVHHRSTQDKTQNKAGTPNGGSPIPSVLPSLGLPGKGGVPGSGAGPEQIAGLALTALGQSTNITSSGPTTIAGRQAYELVASPKDQTSRIGSVRLGIDAQAHIPLRVQVFARGAGTPAVEIGFTQISLAKPDAAEFVFNPPPGTTIVEAPNDSATPGKTSPDKTSPDNPAKGAADRSGFAVVGSGWNSVLAIRLPASADTATKAALDKTFASLPDVSGAFGHGKVLTGALFSVLRTDDGRLLVGAVGPDQLVQAAADPAAKLSN
jgi:outer membrane lipoprotein-sorting protein